MFYLFIEYILSSQQNTSLSADLLTFMSYLLEGGKEGIINPMVFNMAPAYENAKYPNIWISTSRIKGKAILPPLPGNNKNQIILEIIHLTTLRDVFS